MRVLYFGTYLPDYCRNKVIIEGLKRNGVSVIECQVDLWKGIEPRWEDVKGLSGIIKTGWRILFSQARLLWLYQDIGRYDVMLVGYTGHFDVFLARILSSLKRRPLIFDAFISLYNTFVEDRGLFSLNSFVSKGLYTIDKITCRLADGVFLDTHSHIDYFRERLGLKEVRFFRLWVGTDDKLYYPRVQKRKNERFTVTFIGTFIPLQGAQYITESARLLKNEDIRFRFVGKGQEYKKIRNIASGLENIEFTGWIPPSKLPDEIASADVCLGIFGNTEKAKRVIANKIYGAVAMGKPVITGDSPAIREVFTDRENILLCNMADPTAIADAIRLLKEDKNLRTRIAKGAYELFRKEFTPDAIGIEAKKSISKVGKVFNF